MSTCGEESDSWMEDEESDLEDEDLDEREDGGGWDNDFYSYPLHQEELVSESDYCNTEDEEDAKPQAIDIKSVVSNPKDASSNGNCTDASGSVISTAENGSGNGKDVSKAQDNGFSGQSEEGGGDEEDMDSSFGDATVSEMCLFANTKPPDIKLLSGGCESRGTQTGYNLLDLYLFEDRCYDGCEIPEMDWYELTDLIFNRNGKGILCWVKERDISERTKRTIAKAVDSPLKIAIRAGSVTIFNYFLGEGFPFDPVCHPFFEATREGSLPHLKRMLEVGVDIDTSNDERMTALHIAAREPYDYSSVIQFLASNDADLDALDQYGATPIFRAVMSGSEKNINALIAAGASMNVQNYEGRPLLHAGVCRGFKMVKCLYRAGARPGSSPIYDEVRAAVRERQINTLRYLIQKNAPLRIKSFKKNLTSLCHIFTCQDPDAAAKMLDMLLGAGYDVAAEPDIEELVPARFFRSKRGHGLRKKLDSQLTNPRSLKELSCFKVRRTHGTSLPEVLEKITLCPVLKKYLQLKHL